jgi:glutamate-1-semialdehyde 2,1-aminomutase
VYQAGTLSANPVAMTAGLVTLRKLLDSKHYDRLESLGRKLETSIDAIDGLSLQRSGSIFWLTPQDENTTPRAPADIPDDIKVRYSNMFRFLLNAGIYFPPSPYEVGFLSTAHHDAHIDALTKTLERFPA